MAKPGLVKIFYESARGELIHRIGLRDNALLVYLGAMTTLFGVSLGTSISIASLLAVPFVALGATIIVSQHNAIIGSLASYCATEIQAYLDRTMKKDCPPQWENSVALCKYHRTSMRLRTGGHSILLLAPVIAALALNWQHALSSPFPEGIMWWFGAVCAGVSCWIIRSVHIWRAKLYDERAWYNSSH